MIVARTSGTDADPGADQEDSGRGLTRRNTDSERAIRVVPSERDVEPGPEGSTRFRASNPRSSASTRGPSVFRSRPSDQ